MAVLAAIAAASENTRTWRLAAFLATASVVVVLTTYLDGTLGSGIAIVAFGLAAFACLWPDRFNLGAISPAQADLDRLFRAFETTAEGGGRVPAALVQDSKLATWADQPPLDPWSSAARLYRHFGSCSSSADGIREGKPLPRTFREAAHTYWVVASRQRTIGRKPTPSVWTEDVLLRCIWDEFEDLLPASILDNGGDIAGSEIGHAQQVVEAARACRLIHPHATASRNQMVVVMELDVRIAKGDRSSEAIAEQRAAVDAMARTWAELATEEARRLHPGQ
jgi:hypothetical protein